MSQWRCLAGGVNVTGSVQVPWLASLRMSDWPKVNASRDGDRWGRVQQTACQAPPSTKRNTEPPFRCTKNMRTNKSFAAAYLKLTRRRGAPATGPAPAPTGAPALGWTDTTRIAISHSRQMLAHVRGEITSVHTGAGRGGLASMRRRISSRKDRYGLQEHAG